MLVTIPMSKGEKLSPEVRRSIENQSIPCKIKICWNDEIFKGDRRKDELIRNRIISKSRNLCLPYLAKEEITIMHDSSVIHNNPDNIKDALNLLKKDKNVVAVSIPSFVRSWFKLEHIHIKNGCIVARKKVWENVEFKIDPPHKCTCYSFCEQSRKLGIYRFVDRDFNRIKRIMNN